MVARSRQTPLGRLPYALALLVPALLWALGFPFLALAFAGLLLAGYRVWAPGLFTFSVRPLPRGPISMAALCRLGLLLGEGIWVAAPRKGTLRVVAAAGRVPFRVDQVLPREVCKAGRPLWWRGRRVGWWGVVGEGSLPASSAQSLQREMDLLLAEALSRRVALRRLAVAPTSLLKTLPCPVAWLDREGRVLVWTEEAAALCPGLQEGRFWDEVASSLPEGIRVEARSWPAGTLLYFQKEVSLEKERFAVMGQMAAVAAHEIRNPLTAIQGFLQLLQKDLESPRHKEYLRIALEEMERIAHLTQDMLVMVRQPLRGEASSLAEGVAAAWEILRPLAEAGGHRLEVDMPQGSLKVPLSESHLRQILLNLFRNALEAMPEGGTVRVRAWKRAGEMGFSVEDEGPGIPPEEIPKIFSPLYTTKKGGTGLGLPVVGVLVQMSGGKVDVASLPKGGTAFRLSWILPAGAAPGDGRYNRSDDGGTSAPAQ